jgi:hypothetical protein
METILFQEGLDENVIWKVKNLRRWNPENPTLVLNGERFDDDVAVKSSLDTPNYVMSPFGHAWIIPGQQKGKLVIDWKSPEALEEYTKATQKKLNYNVLQHDNVAPQESLTTRPVETLSQPSLTAFLSAIRP